jgi:serine/threonine protein kinase
LEITALEIFQHEYAVGALTVFRHENQDFLVFPYAHGETLRSLWEKSRDPAAHNRQITIKWFEQQCIRIAKVLRCLHGHPPGTPPNCCVVSDRRQESPIGIHCDLNPGNFLLFRDSRRDLDPADPDTWGDIKLSDFGSTLFFSKLELESTQQVGHCDALYRPPESDIRDFLQADAEFSAKFDVWSLGSVWLECITWLVLGADQVKAFEQTRKGGRDPVKGGRIDGGFFEIEKVNGAQKIFIKKCVRDVSNPCCPGPPRTS